ncbi:MAG: carbohydrate ABC transporter permease [Defluviitaleaceae bacterium]|nr:carbohydrate ABC transporter permease [Defluviitaleaceae bacterium]
MSKVNLRTVRRARFNAGLRYFILIVVGLFMAYPLIWMFGSAFKTNFDIFNSVAILPPAGRATFDNYPEAWNISRNNNMMFYYMNTLRFLIPRVIFQVISCTLTAYAIARFNFPGKKLVFGIVMLTLLMPDVAFRIPVFFIFRDLGLLDTFASLYVQEMLAVNSFFVFMIIQFMRTIPRDLDEAAAIDGCGPLRILTYILVPVLRPIIITTALLTFMWGSNDFLGPLIYLNSPNNLVLAQALRGLIGDLDTLTNYGAVFAAATIALVPVLAVFFTCSRYFVQSVTASGGKE